MGGKNVRGRRAGNLLLDSSSVHDREVGDSQHFCYWTYDQFGRKIFILVTVSSRHSEKPISRKQSMEH